MRLAVFRALKGSLGEDRHVRQIVVSLIIVKVGMHADRSER